MSLHTIYQNPCQSNINSGEELWPNVVCQQWRHLDGQGRHLEQNPLALGHCYRHWQPKTSQIYVQHAKDAIRNEDSKAQSFSLYCNTVWSLAEREAVPDSFTKSKQWWKRGFNTRRTLFFKANHTTKAGRYSYKGNISNSNTYHVLSTTGMDDSAHFWSSLIDHQGYLASNRRCSPCGINSEWGSLNPLCPNKTKLKLISPKLSTLSSGGVKASSSRGPGSSLPKTNVQIKP